TEVIQVCLRLGLVILRASARTWPRNWIGETLGFAIAGSAATVCTAGVAGPLFAPPRRPRVPFGLAINPSHPPSTPSPPHRHRYPAATGGNGRSGGTRTPGPRFWRPMLYQLSYTPIGLRPADRRTEPPHKGQRAGELLPCGARGLPRSRAL